MRQYKLLRGYVLDISSEATRRLMYIDELSNEVDEIIADIEEKNKKPTWKERIKNKWNGFTKDEKIGIVIGIIIYPTSFISLIKLLIDSIK
jgi:hypothetical protein